MTDKKKQGTPMKSLSVAIKLVCADGYKANWDGKSNAPGAKTPATPAQTAISAAGQLLKWAEFYDQQGVQGLLDVISEVNHAWTWRGENGYEVGADPLEAVLKTLAEDMGYDLIKKEPTDGPKADERSGTPPGQPAGG